MNDTTTYCLAKAGCKRKWYCENYIGNYNIDDVEEHFKKQHNYIDSKSCVKNDYQEFIRNDK